jgi:hypothetical protein
MFDLRRSQEHAIRRQVSEHVILQVHDAIYTPVRRALDSVHGAVAQAIRETLGLPPEPGRFGAALAELRRLLARNARERELQRVLFASGLLDPAGTCRTVSEVTMHATDDNPRSMRMDLVVDASENEAAQVIELKRGSHRLVARRGTPVERVAEPLAKAVRQVRGYGDRLQSETATRMAVEERHDLELDRLELRLVAGRRLPDPGGYHLLSQAERDDGLELHISTWDGFLAELERIGVP